MRVKPRKLQAGDVAPDIKATDVSGNAIRLKKIDSHYVLVVFFRYSGCPWCNLAIHRLSLEYKTLKNHGCEVITFVQSKKADIVDNIYSRQAPKPKFPIVADSERAFYDAYGVQDSAITAIRSVKKVPIWFHAIKDHGFMQKTVDGNLFLVPASFLLDGRTKKVLQANYGTSYYETDAFMDIYSSVFYKVL